ncbi:MAG: hypothetical protein KatS3mg111_3909 [Pirellulaceae bacterium]|nr:MAG: hypothetical protein KatS3mg111_3909 [Pirellulaceae bacterium]
MPIDFPCPSCEKRLRVPDEAAGKKAQCPACGSLVDVPAGDWEVGDAVPEASQWHASGGAPASTNPYAAPSEVGSVKPVGVQGKIVPTAVDPGAVLTVAWDIWKANLGLLVGVTLIVGVVNMLFSGVAVMLDVVAERGNAELEMTIDLINAGLRILSTLVGVYLGIGQAQINLRLLRGQSAQIGDLFAGGDRFLPTLVVSILYGIAVAVGTALCIIPGMIVALLYWPAYYLVVDGKSTAIESFQIAQTLAKPNVGTTIILVVASVGITIAGILACGVGTLFAIPLLSMMWAVLYLGISGQLRLPG